MFRIFALINIDLTNALFKESSLYRKIKIFSTELIHLQRNLKLQNRKSSARLDRRSDF